MTQRRLGGAYVLALAFAFSRSSAFQAPSPTTSRLIGIRSCPHAPTQIHHHAASASSSSGVRRRRRTVLRSSSDDKEDTTIDKVENYEWTKQTFDIGLPALIGMVADPLLSLVDTGFVGHLGAVPLAALGACTSIFHLAFNAFRATTTATTSLVATSLSTAGRDEKENRDEARMVVDTSLRLGLTIGALVLLALSLGWSWALGTMGIGSDSALLQPARSYLRIRALAAPAVLLISVSEGAFRGYGNTRIPLLASFIAAITNVILDPIFMFPMKMKVGGAAAATAISQMAAAAVYAIFLRRRKMMPQKIEKKEKDVAVSKSGQSKPSINRAKIVMEILRANAAMFAKQGSLLFGWAYATARATRIGHYHVAAHQIALSFWLIFALVLDGSAVSAQVLMSRNYAAYQSNGCAVDDEEATQCGVCSEARRSIHSLTRYMFKFALAQGLLSTMAIFGLGQFAPSIFTTDPSILSHLKDIIPILAWQQILISLTLVTESLAIGASKFNLIAVGTAISTLIAINILAGAKSVVDIWSGGIIALFVGRLITACIGVLDLNGAFEPIVNWFRAHRQRGLTKNKARA